MNMESNYGPRCIRLGYFYSYIRSNRKLWLYICDILHVHSNNYIIFIFRNQLLKNGTVKLNGYRIAFGNCLNLNPIIFFVLFISLISFERFLQSPLEIIKLVVSNRGFCYIMDKIVSPCRAYFIMSRFGE